MENKQSFGAFICKRRKELGLTQKEFAQRLFVTDSAVSKWERGLAYPDITLLQSICQILQISEKELLSASEDTEGRRAEHLARKYLRLTRNYRLFQYVLYGLIALGCFIGNLAAQHTLDWFWIVLSAEAMAASLTLLPALMPEGQRGLWSLGGFTASLLLLLAVCCIYTGGNWFFIAASATLFGMGFVFLPFVLKRVLPERHKTLLFPLYLAVEMGLLLILLAFCCVFGGGNWYLPTAAGILFGAGLCFLPFVLPRLPLPHWLKNRKFTLYIVIETLLLILLLAVTTIRFRSFLPSVAGVLFGVGLVFGPLILRQLPLKGRRPLIYVTAETILLLLIYGACCLVYRQSWFVSASLWTVFGAAVTLLPFLMKQLPLPERFRHRALVWLGICSALLLLGLAWEGIGAGWFFPEGLPIALLCLALPWGWLGCIRYLPANGWLRASASFFWSGLWLWLSPWVFEKIQQANGWYSSHPYTLKLAVDFSNWSDYTTCGANVTFLILLGIGLLGLVCAIIGFTRPHKRSSC